MADLFTERMNTFMRPMDDFTGTVVDATYFLGKDGSLIFAEGYCHPEGGLYGKIIYYPDPKGDFAILGRRYGATNKHMKNGELVLTSHRDQIALHYEIRPHLKDRCPLPPFAEFHAHFMLDEMEGYFDHRHSLREAMKMEAAVKQAVTGTARDFHIPLENLGVTGSLSYGKFEHPLDDIDLTFYGTVEENNRLVRSILELTSSPGNQVIEFGRMWPVRFYHDGVMVCSFFQYGNPAEIPLRTIDMEIVENDVEVKGKIVRDDHTIFMPSIVVLSDAVVSGAAHPDIPVIMYDGSLRGEFYRGDRIAARGKLVRVNIWGAARESLLVTLSEDIGKIEKRK